jgi:hypothetical protein
MDFRVLQLFIFIGLFNCILASKVSLYSLDDMLYIVYEWKYDQRDQKTGIVYCKYLKIFYA